MGAKKAENDVNLNKGLDKYPVDITDTFYANSVRTLNSQYEFLIDFVQQPVRDDGAFEGHRVYVNPQNFKIITLLCLEQLKKFEKQFGEIKI